MRFLKPGKESTFKQLFLKLASTNIGGPSLRKRPGKKASPTAEQPSSSGTPVVEANATAGGPPSSGSAGTEVNAKSGGPSSSGRLRKLTSMQVGRSKHSREVLSISVEHGFIKLLLTRGPEVVGFRVLMASPQFFREGIVSDQAKVAGIIQGALEELSADHPTVIGAVPGFQNTLRLLRLPQAKDLDPTVVIPREARRIMGISLETTQLVWHRLPDEAERSRWLLASAARHTVASLLETAQQAGLKVSVLDFRPFALARVVNRPDAVFAWVAPDGCDVVIIKGSVPLQHQSLFWGAGSTEGFVLAERISDMVERAIALFNDSYPEAAVLTDVPIFMSGSPIGIEPDVASRVASNLQRPAGALAPPLTLPTDFPTHDMVVNLGLALREA